MYKFNLEELKQIIGVKPAIFIYGILFAAAIFMLCVIPLWRESDKSLMRLQRENINGLLEQVKSVQEKLRNTDNQNNIIIGLNNLATQQKSEIKSLEDELEDNKSQLMKRGKLIDRYENMLKAKDVLYIYNGKDITGVVFRIENLMNNCKATNNSAMQAKKIEYNSIFRELKRSLLKDEYIKKLQKISVYTHKDFLIQRMIGIDIGGHLSGSNANLQRQLEDILNYLNHKYLVVLEKTSNIKRINR